MVYRRRRILFALHNTLYFLSRSAETVGRKREKEGQNEPRAIISMARQLRSSRGHLLLRARRPDDRSSFNNLPRVPPRGPLPPPSRVSTPIPISTSTPIHVRAFFPLVGSNERRRRKLRNRYYALARSLSQSNHMMCTTGPGPECGSRGSGCCDRVPRCRCHLDRERGEGEGTYIITPKS